MRTRKLDAMKENVNACPKCGNITHLFFSPGRYGQFVKCIMCGKKGPDRVGEGSSIKAWNEKRKQ